MTPAQPSVTVDNPPVPNRQRHAHARPHGQRSSSSDATPPGNRHRWWSVAALAGALAASIGEMVLNYSIGKRDLARLSHN